MKPLKAPFRFLLVGLFALVATHASGQTVEKQALTHLDAIRNIRADADEKTVADYNKSMDAAWKFFSNNKSAVLPILRREVTLELQKPKPSDILLLDIGYYLRLQPAASDKELGKAALFKLDPTSEIVNLNQQQLFDFAYSVAIDEDPKVLPFLDRAFLRQKVTAFVPQHAFPLSDTVVCVSLYGVHGQDSEAHLRSLLTDQTLTRKILEILIWIGTPESVTEVKQAMLAHRSYETSSRGTTFMMKVGGPEGRAAMLSFDVKNLDAESQPYLQRIRPMIEGTTFETLSKTFFVPGRVMNLSDVEVKKRLAAMYENNGKDNDTEPAAILNSTLPRSFLVNELVRIRTRMFRRLSNEGLGDVLVTNSLLNALYYRAK